MNKKSYVSLRWSLLVLLIIFVLGTCIACNKKGNEDIEDVTNSNQIIEEEDYFAKQNQVDENLLAESQKGYNFDDPFVVVNPYGNSPLSAIVMFDTENKTAVTITVEGKSSEDSITQTFEANTNHILPIYGLYLGDTTKVTLTLDVGE